MVEKKGLLIVLSGPSGVGKGAIKEKVAAALPNSRHSVSVTTRAPRAGEQEGVHYFYRTIEQYQEMIAKSEFLETAQVHLNYYGTPKKPVFDMLANGYDVIFEVDTLGAEQIRKVYPDSILIFIMAPTFGDLEKRLIKRGTEEGDVMKRRISAAKRELEKYKNYDYLVINDEIEECAQRILNIIECERNNTKRMAPVVSEIMKDNK